MSRYFEEMRSAIEQHGGTVEKFIGDAVMAVFGVPTVHEDDALRAVRAASQMREILDTLNAELERDFGARLQVRIGINTGEVVAGDPSAGETFVTGDTVNVAARFEQTAEPGEVVFGQETHRLVRDAVQVEPVEPLELKGKTDRVPAFRLVDVTPGAPAFARRLDSPLVGREEELGRLQRVFDEAVERARLPDGHRPRRRRAGQVTPGDRARRARRRSRPGALGPVPALRRGHHVLAGRRAGQGGRGDRRDRRAGRRAIQAARARRGRGGRRRGRRPGLGGDRARRGRRGRRRHPGDVLGGPHASSRSSRRTARSSSCSRTSIGPSRPSSTCCSTSRASAPSTRCSSCAPPAPTSARPVRTGAPWARRSSSSRSARTRAPT